MARSHSNKPYCTVCGKGATHMNDKTGDTVCEPHLALNKDAKDYYVIKE